MKKEISSNDIKNKSNEIDHFDKDKFISPKG
jgi:hypothetical protein